MSSEEVASYARVRTMVGANLPTLFSEFCRACAAVCMNHRTYAVVRIPQGAASPTTVALTDVCSSLLDDCLSLNSRDNMTASIVRASSLLLWAWVNNHRVILCRDIWEGVGWQLHCLCVGKPNSVLTTYVAL
jgi:hypothetical protein